MTLVSKHLTHDLIYDTLCLYCQEAEEQSTSFTPGAVVAAVSSVPEGPVAMNDRGITRVSKDQPAEMIDETDWARVAAMTEADIERAAAEDPDASLTTTGDWEDTRVVWPQTTEPVTLRLDSDVLAWFRRQGPGYQVRINAVLRAFVKAHER
jgi:uncharacterized protein (DUF4415 family)